jgi:hypothetical protein
VKCVETLQAALAKHGKPEIFNTDQGSLFTGSSLHRRLNRDALWPQRPQREGDPVPRPFREAR